MTRHSFGVVRRGYDPREVRSYLELVARELAAWEEREQEYRRQLQEAKHRAQNPVLDEATITQALGQQTAAVLRKAHEEAARLVADAEERAVTLTREAQQRVTETTVQAEASGAERIAEAELAAGSVRHQAEEEARRIAEAARQEGDTVMARAREHGRLMVEEAQNARKRVLGDMAQRRRLVHVQIEQLRAARDELAAAVMSVRDRFDEITGKLATAEDEARQAAAATGQRIAADGSEYEIEVTESSDLLVHEVLAGAHVAPDEEMGEAPQQASSPGTLEAEQAEPDQLGGVGTEAAGRQVTDSPTGGPPTIQQPTVDEPRPGEPGSLDATAVVPVTESGGGGNESAEGGSAHASSGEAPTGEVEATPFATGETGEDSTLDDRSVEELFARIRASQSEGSAEGGAEEGAEAHPPGGEPDGVADAALDGVAGSEDDDTELVPERSGEDTALLARREELLGPVQAKLSRRLKRALQDDQNRLLDELRSRSGEWSGDLLGSEAEHLATFSGAALPLLREAAGAGRQFPETAARSGGKRALPPEAMVRPVADDLAETVVALLRRRLPGGDEGPTVDELDDASDAVGAAFREWRGAKVERLVGDYSVQAFSLGILDAVGSGAQVRWVVGGDGPPCADCDDNSLAGAIPAGEDFPTGHPCPPAHAGCRCLVAPAG